MECPAVALRTAEDLLSFKKGVNMHLREELITKAQSDFHFYLSKIMTIQPYKYTRACKDYKAILFSSFLINL